MVNPIIVLKYALAKFGTCWLAGKQPASSDVIALSTEKQPVEHGN